MTSAPVEKRRSLASPQVAGAQSDMDLADSFRTQSFHLMQAHPIAAAHLVLAAASIAPTCAAEQDVADKFSFVIADFVLELGALHRRAVNRQTAEVAGGNHGRS